MQMMADHDWQARLQIKRCRACHYVDPPSGKELWQELARRCKCCDKGVCPTGGKVLCLDCASRHALCTRCGGDLEMLPRREFIKPHRVFKNPDRIETAGREDILI